MEAFKNLLQPFCWYCCMCLYIDSPVVVIETFLACIYIDICTASMCVNVFLCCQSKVLCVVIIVVIRNYTNVCMLLLLLLLVKTAVVQVIYNEFLLSFVANTC